jgi:hypothetical protein
VILIIWSKSVFDIISHSNISVEIECQNDMKKHTQKSRQVPLGKSCPAEGWNDLFIYSYRPLVLAAARSNHAPNLFFGNFLQGNKSGAVCSSAHTKAYRRKINQFA